MPRDGRQPGRVLDAARAMNAFMAPDGTTPTPQRVHFLLIPEFSFIALAAILEPLRVANRFGGALYEWTLVAEQPGPVLASNGIQVQATHGLADVDGADTVLVCASFNPRRYLSPAIRGWLRRLDSQGATLGAVDTGLYFLADAGLVGRDKVTLHWEQIPCYSEDYPGAHISNELFELSPRRMYCSGGTASIDMMLHLIMREHGRQLALAISEQFLLSRIRTASEHQRLEVAMRHQVFNKRLTLAILQMEQHIENPISIDDVAAGAHISRRQLERLFKTSFGATPSGFYLDLRLQRARSLLKETDLSVTEVSVATGFESVSYFSRTYRSVFKQTPSRARGPGRRPARTPR